MKKTFKITITLDNGKYKTFGAFSTLKKLKRFLKKKILEIPIENTLHIVKNRDIKLIVVEEIVKKDNVMKIKEK